jgi:hypothetical protein
MEKRNLLGNLDKTSKMNQRLDLIGLNMSDLNNSMVNRTSSSIDSNKILNAEDALESIGEYERNMQTLIELQSPKTVKYNYERLMENSLKAKERKLSGEDSSLIERFQISK